MYYTMFQIYHTEIDYKLHALNFRQDGTEVVEGIDGDDDL